jgi:signal peptidase complex subunit 1
VIEGFLDGDVYTAMDFKGQKRAEKLSHKMMTYASVIAFLVGYFRQDFTLTLGLFLAGVVVTFLVTVPNWPMYNRDPITWVASKNGQKEQPDGVLAKARLLFS